MITLLANHHYSLWTIFIFVARGAIGSPTAGLTGNVRADVYGILSVPEPGAPNVVKFGRKRNALGMQEDVISSARI